MLSQEKAQNKRWYAHFFWGGGIDEARVASCEWMLSAPCHVTFFESSETVLPGLKMI